MPKLTNHRFTGNRRHAALMPTSMDSGSHASKDLELIINPLGLKVVVGELATSSTRVSSSAEMALTSMGVMQFEAVSQT
jgi:hypothetical protein